MCVYYLMSPKKSGCSANCRTPAGCMKRSVPLRSLLSRFNRNFNTMCQFNMANGTLLIQHRFKFCFIHDRNVPLAYFDQFFLSEFTQGPDQ
jgi:hypothetical protein